MDEKHVGDEIQRDVERTEKMKELRDSLQRLVRNLEDVRNNLSESPARTLN